MSGPFGSSQWMYKSGSYEIANSLRFNASDTPVLARTYGTATNRKIWTLSVWVKRSNISGGTYPRIMSTATGNDNINFMNTDTLRLESDFGQLITAQVFRDVSAWYHIVVAYDSTQGTAANRVKFFINGTQVTEFGTTNYPDQDDEIDFNSDVIHQIGQYADGGSENMEGYMAEMHWIDGTAKVPTDFAESGDYGEWNPIKYDGSYGDEGWYLDFKSSGVGTAGTTTIGADRSGNTNHWTSSNIATTDQMIDTPTNNFCTAHAIDVQTADKLKEGALQVEPGNGRTRGTMAVTSGKWYFEVLLKDQSNSTVDVGISGVVHEVGTDDGNEFVRIQHPSNGEDKVRLNIAGSTTDEIGAVANGDIIGCFFDMAAEEVSFLVNNSAIAASCTGVDFSGLTNKDMMVPIVITGGGRRIVCNFGQDSSFSGNKTAGNNADGKGIGDFFYAPPSGFLALCASNLPESSVIPQEHFNTLLYTGSGSAAGHRGLGFRPNWIWGKKRGTAAQNHWWITDVTNINKQLISDNDGSEGSEANGTAFDPDGFDTAGNDLFYNNGSPYVVWCWKGNGTNTSPSNTNGSINTQATNANIPAGFSITAWAGTGATGTVGHGLGQAPQLIIVKNRDDDENWCVLVNGVGGLDATDFLRLDTDIAVVDDADRWNDTAPSATVFTVDTDNQTNGDGDNMVAWCFHSVEGYSKVGSYKGNNNANGAFINTGFRPAFVLTKQSSATGDWTIHDSARDIDNPLFNELNPNTNGAEGTSDADMDFTANGFKIRRASGQFNANDATVIYLAFAETPFKYANGR